MAKTKPKKKGVLDYLKEAWHFLWHGDSVWSWVANVIVAFVVIKYVLYPLAGLILGTSLPVVAVVSSSMDHRVVDGSLCGEMHSKGVEYWEACGDWYEERGISQENFNDFPFKRGFWKGDVILLKGWSPESLEVGDVIVFESGKQYPIIHRLVEINEDGTYTTKGDHNEDSIEEYAVTDGRYLYRCYQQNGNTLQASLCGPGTEFVTENTPGAIQILDEKGITEERVIGEGLLRLPLIGYVKIWFVDLLQALGLTSVAQAF